MNHRSIVFGLSLTALMAYTAPLAAQSSQDYSSTGQELEQPLNLAIDYGRLSANAGTSEDGTAGTGAAAKPDQSGVDMSNNFGTWEFSPVIFGRRQNGTKEESAFGRNFGLELKRNFQYD